MTSRAWLASALCIGLGGCIAQGGVHVSDAFRPGPNHVAWGGQVVTAVEWNHIYLGPELEGRIEHHGGSLLTGGLQVGATTDGNNWLNGVLHADVGVPVGWGNVSGWYLGATAALPLRIFGLPPLSDRNRRLRVIGSSPELAPYIRFRFYRLELATGREDTADLAIGLALRVKFATDLL